MTDLSLLYLAIILVIFLKTSYIRWLEQPSMEPPPFTTSKCSLNTFVPSAIVFLGTNFCNLFSHSCHNIFPFICFKLITWRVLLALLTPKPPYESCSGNFSVQFHWERSIKLNWNFSQKERKSFEKSMFSGPAWNFFRHFTPCLVFRVTMCNVGYPEFHTTCKYLIMYIKLNGSRKTSYKSPSHPSMLSELVHSDPVWKTGSSLWYE